MEWGTRLLRRYMGQLALIWTILVVGASLLFYFGEQNDFRRLAHSVAQTLSDRDLLYRHWSARSGGVYAPVSAETQPNPYLLHVRERDVVTPSGRHLTLVNPDQMVVQVNHLGAVQGVRLHLASLAPIRPENAADAWETEGLNSFATGVEEREAFLEENGQQVYRYMRPLIVGTECLDCHATHGYAIGEIRGAYSLTLPLQHIFAAKQGHLLLGLSGYLLLWGAGIGGGIIFNRRLEKQSGEQQQSEARLSAAQRDIHYLTHCDPLTGLPNRQQFDERLQQLLAEETRHDGGFAVGVLGIDHYKRLKNTFGLQLGEDLLKETVRRIATVLRPEDLLACLSESRLLLLLPGVSQADDVTRINRRIRDALSAPIVLKGQEFFVSATCGFSLAPTDSRDARTLISNADAAFSRAKTMGRDNCLLHAPMLNQRAIEQITMENNLRRALERQQLEIFYQPQVDSRSGHIVGAEALLRWQNPQVGIVSPTEFIPLAEETGMILPIGEWVLASACRAAVAWSTEFSRPLVISVNISPRQFMQSDLVAIVDDVLATTGLPASCLVLEVTEGSIVQDVDKAVALLKELKKRGIRIAIDDFGTGYSSLNYLKTFPVDQVKIDKSFVSDSQQRGTNSVIVTSIVTMAQKLNLEVIAEGVETEAQCEFLQSLGCYYMQGYYFCRPMDAGKFINLVQALQDESSEYFTWWSEPGQDSVLTSVSGSTQLHRKRQADDKFTRID